MTIDGVANIDTGDNGGNMATTNIDAVAEFKVLTNAYAAEYGRAVGAPAPGRDQERLARRSTARATGTAAAPTGTPTSWTNKRVTPEIPKAKTSRNDGGYTIGGPVFFPGFNEEKKKLFFFFSQEHQRRTDPLADARETRVPTALERRGDFSQSVDASGNPFPYIRDYTHRPALQRRRTRAAASRTAACSAGFRPNRLYAARPRRPEHLPAGQRHGAGAGLNFTSQDADQHAAP